MKGNLKMAINQELTSFVKEGLGRGLPRAQLQDALRDAGWSSDQVRTALNRYADVEFAIPVPRPKPYLFAREAFVYLVIFSTLYVSAFNLGNLLFEFINRAFPDPAIDPAWALEASRQSIRWSISLLVVSFPVFLLSTLSNERAIQRNPNLRLSTVRRWLTYMTLFIAASVLIGDVTSVVYNLLGGELTTRFVLKVATVGAIAGSVFWHLVRELRKEEVDE